MPHVNVITWHRRVDHNLVTTSHAGEMRTTDCKSVTLTSNSQVFIVHGSPPPGMTCSRRPNG